MMIRRKKSKILGKIQKLNRSSSQQTDCRKTIIENERKQYYRVILRERLTNIQQNNENHRGK